ncbi:MAG: hypothetical protein WBG50_28615 [Desulfomonilaceae bacterium]
MLVSRTFVIVAAGILLLAILCTIPAVSSAQVPGIFEKYQQCKADCNEAYGGYDQWPSPFFPMGHAECFQKCERSFWRDFDRQNAAK